MKLRSAARATDAAAVLIGAAVVLAVGGAVANAGSIGYIYWSNVDTGSIARANIDGTGVHQGLITGARLPLGVAIDSRYVYWGDAETGAIGRATLAGNDVDQHFIPNLRYPDGIAVAGKYIYWVDQLNESIGRANLDGTGVNDDFIKLPLTRLIGLAVDATHVYWCTNGGTIGRARLDGTGVNRNLVSVATNMRGIALDSSHIYWAGDFAIGRADLDGTSVDANFIKVPDVRALAVSNGRIYYGFQDLSVGEVKTDGTGRLDDLITVDGGASGIAVTGTVLPRAAATPDALGFGTHTLDNYSTPKTVTISDTGTAPLAVSDLKLTGLNAADFLISQDDCSGNTVRPGGSCAIKVLFGPSDVGDRSATLSVQSDDPLSPLLVALSGRGELPVTGVRGTNELIACKSAGHGAERCTGKLGRGLGTFTTARATISRGVLTYASGTAAPSPARRLRLLLTDRRPLGAGRYALTLSERVRGRWVSRGISIRIN
jgi:Low-density lipoprotein receptor repeat class B